MLWYKSWIDTRWRFLLGLALLLVLACGTVVELLDGAAISAASMPQGRSSATRRLQQALRESLEIDAHVPRLRVVAVVRGRLPRLC